MLNEKIVRELVAYSCGVQIPNPSTLCGYAAEVIEEQAKEIEKLRAQNEQLREAAALVAKESAEPLERRWIPVTERLPEYGVRVLAFNMRAKNKYIGIWTREKDPGDGNDCWFDSAGWWYAFDEITHWMPLPEPPETHAQWIEDGSGIIICPECKRGYNLHAKYTHYCPNCGAKMDGGDDHTCL